MKHATIILAVLLAFAVAANGSDIIIPSYANDESAAWQKVWDEAGDHLTITVAPGWHRLEKPVNWTGKSYCKISGYGAAIISTCTGATLTVGGANTGGSQCVEGFSFSCHDSVKWFTATGSNAKAVGLRIENGSGLNIRDISCYYYDTGIEVIAKGDGRYCYQTKIWPGQITNCRLGIAARTEGNTNGSGVICVYGGDFGTSNPDCLKTGQRRRYLDFAESYGVTIIHPMMHVPAEDAANFAWAEFGGRFSWFSGWLECDSGVKPRIIIHSDVTRGRLMVDRDWVTLVDETGKPWKGASDGTFFLRPLTSAAGETDELLIGKP